jgi:hypothetical protein
MTSPIPQDNFNTFEYNYLEYAGHALFVSNAFYNVIANNIGPNEPFIAGCTNYLSNDPTSTTSIKIPSVGQVVHLVTQTGITNLAGNYGLTVLNAADCNGRTTVHDYSVWAGGHSV